MNENTMNRMKHLFCVLLLAALGSFSFKANAYTERNMLQKAADESTLKNVLVMKQAWVPYPCLYGSCRLGFADGSQQTTSYRSR